MPCCIIGACEVQENWAVIHEGKLRLIGRHKLTILTARLGEHVQI